MEKPLVPYVLTAHAFRAVSNSRSRTRVVRDYELSLFLRGGGTIWLCGEAYPAEAGAIMLRRPGQLVSSEPPYLCELLHLDLSGRFDRARGSFDLLSGPVQEECKHPLIASLPTIVHPRNETRYRTLHAEMRELLAWPSTFDETLLCAKAMEYVSLLNADARTNAERLDLSSDRRVTREAMRWFEAHARERVLLEDAARAAHLSASHLRRVFTRTAGITPLAYVTRIRMERARRLLAETDLTVGEIAMDCGFGGASYFIKTFRDQCGVTPTAYRERIAP